MQQQLLCHPPFLVKESILLVSGMWGTSQIPVLPLRMSNTVPFPGALGQDLESESTALLPHLKQLLCPLCWLGSGYFFVLGQATIHMQEMACSCFWHFILAAPYGFEEGEEWSWEVISTLVPKPDPLPQILKQSVARPRPPPSPEASSLQRLVE